MDAKAVTAAAVCSREAGSIYRASEITDGLPHFSRVRRSAQTTRPIRCTPSPRADRAPSRITYEAFQTRVFTSYDIEGSKPCHRKLFSAFRVNQAARVRGASAVAFCRNLT